MRSAAALASPALLAALIAAEAQPARRLARVGILTVGAPNLTAINRGSARLFPPVFQELRERGYTKAPTGD
jgi:hypothetical protein